MEFKKLVIIRKIAAPFIAIFFSGFIGIIKWNTFVSELHEKAKEEKRNNVWFTKKTISMYLSCVFMLIVNLFSWFTLFYFYLNLNH